MKHTDLHNLAKDKMSRIANSKIESTPVDVSPDDEHDGDDSPPDRNNPYGYLHHMPGGRHYKDKRSASMEPADTPAHKNSRGLRQEEVQPLLQCVMPNIKQKWPHEQLRLDLPRRHLVGQSLGVKQ